MLGVQPDVLPVLDTREAIARCCNEADILPLIGRPANINHHENVLNRVLNATSNNSRRQA